jgi:hypothetical protein
MFTLREDAFSPSRSRFGRARKKITEWNVKKAVLFDPDFRYVVFFQNPQNLTRESSLVLVK